MDEKPDFDSMSTTAVLVARAPGLAWLPIACRKRLSPALLWSAILALTGAVAYIAKALNDVHQHQQYIEELQTSRRQDHELLQSIETNVAVMTSQVGDIKTEVDRQREWRERIESVAEEAPPHGRRHK